jgi:enoyl-CoA hydratase/carnithine racemase
MEYQNILVEKGRIAKVTLNRPEKRNALSAETMVELKTAFLELDRDPEVVVIILSGNGKGFCSGADLGGVMENPGVMDSRQVKGNIMEVLVTMGKIGKVVISQVHGFAMAGGFGLAVTADLTVIADDCKLGMPEIKRGLTPMNIMNPIARCMPRKRILEMMLSGDNISPNQAMEWGLANRVVPIEQLEEETLKLAESIACNSGAALKLCKDAFYVMQDMNYYTAFNYLTDMLTINAMTEDSKEGIHAFFEKRQPIWKDK